MLNMKDLKKLLNESLVNPNKPGPWKVIADIGEKNPTYLRLRAIELVEETSDDANMVKAITMLLLARYFNARSTRLSRVATRGDGGSSGENLGGSRPDQ